MTRVQYLAGLVGSTERRPAPALRPPRRLFPHEPPPAEPLPLPQAAGEAGGDPPTPAPPVVEAEPVSPEHVRREPARSEPEVVTPTRLRKPNAPSAPVADAPQPETVRVGEAPVPAAVRKATRATGPPPLVRVAVRAPRPTPASRDLEPARVAVPRRPATTLEPSRLRPPAAVQPELVPAANQPAAAAARAPVLHIGSIDVTVAPPPEPPREPTPAAPSAPVHRPPAPFDQRGASMGRWFGLAQR
ncbi:MAG TPA: hypothetical protein VGK69_09180 [Gaiellaceae bacterium]